MFAATRLLKPHLFIPFIAWPSAKEANTAGAAGGDGPGIQAICMVEEEECGIIQQTYNVCRPKQAFKNNQYIELFAQGKTTADIVSTTVEEVEDACDANIMANDEELDQLVHKIVGDCVLQKYGFIVAPANSTLYQHFHIDYLNTVSSYFIPLVDWMSQNAPHYIPNFVGNPTDGEEIFGSKFTLMEKEGLLGMVVAQTICWVFTLLFMSPRTIHRGIPNW